MPSEVLAELGVGATVLIHEATHADDLSAQSNEKNHSSVSQALKIGAQMNAWRVILTHFSQRYTIFPNIKGFENAIVAFDHIRIKFSECDDICSIMPYVENIFGLYYADS